MVIFMPYYRQHGQLFNSHARPRSTSSNEQSNTTITTTTTNSGNSCKFACGILCRCTFSLFLLIIGLCLLRISIINDTYDHKEGSPIIAVILLTISIVSLIRTCQKLRHYFIILDTRRRLAQRLRERQQAYDLTIAINNDDNPSNVHTDLPTYKELFSSHLNLNNNGNDLPSYDDFVKTNVIRSPITSLPLRSHTVSLPTTSSQSPPNSTRCIWITDRTQRPLCISGTVTYV